QRGPGLASRQRDHRLAGLGPDVNGPRSTRAGTRVPATGVRAALPSVDVDLRSTRAGTRVPATASISAAEMTAETPRSTRAGTRVPATGATRAGRPGRR